MLSSAYATDVSDAEWAIPAPLSIWCVAYSPNAAELRSIDIARRSKQKNKRAVASAGDHYSRY
jgi:hypothetical protein